MSAEAPERRRAVFLDRDGVIVDLVEDPLLGTPESPYSPGDVRLMPGVAEALRELRADGWALVVVSNQPAAAKGNVSLDDLRAVHERAAELLASEGVELDEWRYCFHHPDGTVPELSGTCDCRKPAPGMLLDAARDLRLDLRSSWMVGDSDTDVLAGERAGCRTVLVEHPGSAHRRQGKVEPGCRGTDLHEVVARCARNGLYVRSTFGAMRKGRG